MTRRRCPICHRIVGATRWERVVLHRDSIGRDLCPMSGELFELCEHEPLMDVVA